MRYLVLILILIHGLLAQGQGTRIGSVQNSNSFDPANALMMSNITTDVYHATRKLGQVGIGDILYTDVGLTTPVDGGFGFWFGFIKEDGGSNNIRAYKISGTGEVLDIAVYLDVGSGQILVPIAYHNNSGASNCAGTGFTSGIYSTPDDLDFYSNKRVWGSPTNLGTSIPNGNYTASSSLNGTSTWTFTVASGNSILTSIACCSGTPVANAGPDANFSLPNPTINLNGTGYDCDGTITNYAWARISGPNTPTITPSSSSTTGTTSITGVVAGIYVFRLTVTDNSSNTHTDDVTVEVFSAPTCGATPGLINIQPHYCFGLSHQMTTSIRGIPGRKFGHAKVFFDGDANPIAGDFDMDDNTGGVQADLTSIQPAIYIHDVFKYGKNAGDNTGTQMAVLVKLDKAYNFDRFYYYFKHFSSAMNGLPAVEVYIGNRVKIRNALFQFMPGESVTTPDFVINTKSGNAWDSVKNIQLNGQYILLLYNSFDIGFGKIPADFSSFLFYGCEKTPLEVDSNIGPYWDMTIVKSPPVVARDGINGINEAFPVPVDTPYWNNTLKAYMDKRGYSGLGDASTGGGILDKYPGPWTGEATTPNYIDLAMYGGGASNSPLINVYNFVQTGRRFLNSDRVMNMRLWNQLGNRGEAREHLPVDSLTAKKWHFTSWNRFSYQQAILAIKFGPDNNPNNYPYVRLTNDPWPGQLGMNLWDAQEIGNEWNSGFRMPADSQYLDPWAMGVMMKVVYDKIKSVAPNMKVVIGGYAAWDMEHYWSMEMMLQLYFGQPTKVYDFWNMHTIIITKEFVVNEGYVGSVNLNGALPGLRGERKKVIGFIDTLAMVSGFNRDGYLTEVSYTSNRYGPQDYTGDEVFISTIGAPGYPQHEYPIDQNQAIAFDQMDEHYASVPGVKKKFDYEIKDHVDRIAHPEWYGRADASNGILYIDGSPKAGYFYSMGKKMRLGDYQSINVLTDSIRGTWQHERLKYGTTDSLCWTIMWQDTLDATSPRTFILPAGVTQVRRVRFSMTSINPEIDEIISVPSGTLIWTPNQKADHFFMKGAISLPTRRVIRLNGYRIKLF